MVTVEAAVAVCALLIAMGLAAASLTAVIEQIRCTDAAREAARLSARGERQRGVQAVAQIAPGATAEFQDEGDAVRVFVRQRGPLGVLLTATAFAVVEPR
ncbi:TadE family type IV pilus minor pilin [Lentzea sp. NPDC042327]|uniref:TadE family type IV pilus minor pilin n=1 Tax=Lentzea sp. NPDC042327 TaxID=3154801 RepID=UPI0033F1236D